MNRAQAYLVNKQIEKALSDFEAVIAFDSSNINAYLGKGKALHRMNQHSQALNTFKLALELSANSLLHSADAYYNSGLVYDFLKQEENALEMFDKCITARKIAECAYQKGKTLKKLSNLNAAVKAFQDCVDWAKNREKSALCEREKEVVLNEIEEANEEKSSTKNNNKQECDVNSHDCVS